jgi:hypothetical protein
MIEFILVVSEWSSYDNCKHLIKIRVSVNNFGDEWFRFCIGWEVMSLEWCTFDWILSMLKWRSVMSDLSIELIKCSVDWNRVNLIEFSVSLWQIAGEWFGDLEIWMFECLVASSFESYAFDRILSIFHENDGWVICGLHWLMGFDHSNCQHSIIFEWVRGASRICDLNRALAEACCHWGRVLY